MHIFTGISLCHTKEWNNATCNNTDGPRDDRTDTFTWNLKYSTDEPFYETETESRTQRTGVWLPREGSGRGARACGTGRCELFHTGQKPPRSGCTAQGSRIRILPEARVEKKMKKTADTNV